MEDKKIVPTPFWKMILNDVYLLFFLGAAIYIIFYILWGVMEIANVPPMPDEIKDAVLK